MNSEKRFRAPNYSADEKLRLLNIIAAHKLVVENKKTDALTWRDKEEAWKTITQKFNASSSSKRTAESVKAFYVNQKRVCHKQAAYEKRSMCGTGGGPSITGTADPLLDITMSIVNKKTVYGLDTPFGGDSNVEPNDEECEENFNQIMNYSYIEDCDAVDVLQTDEINIVDENAHEILHEHCYSDKPEATDWSNYTPKTLKKPIHKKLLNPVNILSKPSVKASTRQAKEHTLHSVPSDKWSARRRPTLSATMNVAKKYEDLCAVKKELAATQLRIFKNYEDHQIKLFKMELEEKMVKDERDRELFELDCAIKKAQLKHLQM